MTSTRVLFMTLFLLAFATAGFAADQKADTATSKALKAQTLCPVMGGKIDSAAYTDIQGQRVYHCCPMCSAKLKADPDKYFKQAAEQGILFENVQKACPVTGRAFDKSIYTDYVGRRIYFATANARAQFAKDPVKYLAVLDKQVGNVPAEKATDQSHEDHSAHSSHTMTGGCGH